MDPLNPDVPDALALDRLCAGAAEQLLLHRYSRRMLNRYKLVWKHLTDFAKAQEGSNTYSRDLVLRFEQAFGLREGEPIKSGERWRRHLVVGIKLLDDFARTGNNFFSRVFSAASSFGRLASETLIPPNLLRQR